MAVELELIMLCWYLGTYRALNSASRTLSYNLDISTSCSVFQWERWISNLFTYEAGLSLLLTGDAGGELGLLTRPQKKQEACFVLNEGPCSRVDHTPLLQHTALLFVFFNFFHLSLIPFYFQFPSYFSATVMS